MDVNGDAAHPAKKPSRELLGYVRSGLAYLDRYGGPTARLRRSLVRRARRKGLEAADAEEMIQSAMAEIERLGVLDDAAFARGKASALRRRGASRRGAMAKLQATGLDAATAEAALAEHDENFGPEGDPERVAARRYAERRRLGPWRVAPETRAERRERDIAALARAGFPVGLSIAVIEGSDTDDDC